MKILLSNPPWWIGQNERGQWTAGVRAGSRWPFTLPVRSLPDRRVQGDYCPYPFFLGSAASYVKAALPGVDVAFRDSIALRESHDAWGDWIAAERPDFLVVESATPSWDHDSWLLHQIGGYFPNVGVIVTGPIATAKGAEILAAHPNVVACIKGEYEKGIVRVLKGERGVIDFDLLSEAEMNAMPSPWLDDLHAHLYADTNPRGQQFPQLQLLSSRGCPYKCIFCVWPATMSGNDPDGLGKRTVRHHSPQWLLSFLDRAIVQYGYQSVYFDDDTFNLGDQHVNGVCGVMRAVGVPWSAMCRADTIKMETWEEMRQSGCFGVKIGFESGSQYVVDKIVNKRLDLKAAANTARWLRQSLGMTVHGTFTVGLPGETKAQQQETHDFIVNLYATGGLDTHQLSGTAAVEGTPLDTLATVGKLDKYPGAKVDGDYIMESDGMVKLGLMNRPPRE